MSFKISLKCLVQSRKPTFLYPNHLVSEHYNNQMTGQLIYRQHNAINENKKSTMKIHRSLSISSILVCHSGSIEFLIHTVLFLPSELHEKHSDVKFIDWFSKRLKRFTSGYLTEKKVQLLPYSFFFLILLNKWIAIEIER